MKYLDLLRGLAAVLLLGSAAMAPAHDKHDQPRFGGLVQEGKTVQMELVLQPKTVSLHVSDHGKAVDIKGASAQLALLEGTRRQTVKLEVNGAKFQATGDFPTASGTKAVVLLTLPGKPGETVRFVLK
jgi:hypothetical protein